MSAAGRIFVGGLDCAMTRADLEREFGKYGRLKEVWMAQSPPGFAFVEFEDTSLVDEAVREMNGAIINGALLRVERARDKGRTPRGGGAFRSRSRRGGPGSYQQAGFERKMMRRTPTPTMPPAPANYPMDGVAGPSASTAAGYGCYDYAAAAGGNPYATYAPPGAPTASWEAPYGTTYYATAAAPGYGAYYGDYYGMAGMAPAPMPMADPATAAAFYQQQQQQPQQQQQQQQQQQPQQTPPQQNQQLDYGQMMPPPYM